MPFDPTGKASLPPSTWVEAGQTIRTEQHNPAFRDVEAMLSAVLKRDGRDGMVGPLDMGRFPITNVGNSTSAESVATVGQVRSASPVGIVVPFAGANAPSGWLLCYGQAVSRANYPDLFTAIGTTYGPGDGATTFNVPDYRGVTPVGRDNMGGTTKGLLSKFASTVLGSIFGVQEHTLIVDEMPSHSHSGITGAAGRHQHEVPMPRGDVNYSQGSANTLWGTILNRIFQTSEAPDHTHPFTTDIRGGNQAHPNVQPSMVTNFIIRASY